MIFCGVDTEGYAICIASHDIEVLTISEACASSWVPYGNWEAVPVCRIIVEHLASGSLIDIMQPGFGYYSTGNVIDSCEFFDGDKTVTMKTNAIL